MTGRPAPNSALGNQARKALAAALRWERKADEAAQQATLARDELTMLHRKTCEKFGRQVPTDALLLAVLENIDVEDGDRWIWQGARNNRDTPVVKPGNGREVSLVRYLAIEFGRISPDDFGSLYPDEGDVDDVNPWHRTLRRTEHPTGNPNRFGFTIKDTP